MKKLVIAFLCLFSAVAQAKMTIKTDSRVEILAVNQSINKIPSTGKGDLKIANGENQLLIRVTGLVDANGGKQRFASLPMVIRFSAQDAVLKLETPFSIREQRDVKKFEKAPSVKITLNGESVPYQMDIISDQTFALIKDYNEMLETYNRQGGKAAIQADFETHSVVERPSKSTPKTIVNCTNALAIEEAFLDMTPEQRQKFISWGVQRIND